MMNYIRVHWMTDCDADPVWLYSELDQYRWEVRKVEVFRDGKYGYASKSEAKGQTRLGLEAIPSLEEIAQDDQFRPEEISREEFEDVWEKALILTR